MADRAVPPPPPPVQASNRHPVRRLRPSFDACVLAIMAGMALLLFGHLPAALKRARDRGGNR